MKCTKAVLRENFRAINATIKKKERSQINNQTTPPGTRKKTKTKVMKTKEMKRAKGKSLEVRRLGFQAFSAGCAGSFPGRELRLSFPHAAQHGQKKEKSFSNQAPLTQGLAPCMVVAEPGLELGSLFSWVGVLALPMTG